MIAGDTETTGLLKPELTELYLQPFITEIYLCKFDRDFKIIEEFNTLIKPPVPIPEEITIITGITDEMVSTAPVFAEVYDDLCEFVLGETHMFFHNASFDVGMIALELRRMGKLLNFPWPQHHMCTVEISTPINNKRMKLKDLYTLATGKEMKNAHRAKNDVVQMVECIDWLYKNKFWSVE